MSLWLVFFLPILDSEFTLKSNFAFESIDNDHSGHLDREEMILAVQDLEQ